MSEKAGPGPLQWGKIYAADAADIMGLSDAEAGRQLKAYLRALRSGGTADGAPEWVERNVEESKRLVEGRRKRAAMARAAKMGSDSGEDDEENARWHGAKATRRAENGNADIRANNRVDNKVDIRANNRVDNNVDISGEEEEEGEYNTINHSHWVTQTPGAGAGAHVREETPGEERPEPQSGGVGVGVGMGRTRAKKAKAGMGYGREVTWGDNAEADAAIFGAQGAGEVAELCGLWTGGAVEKLGVWRKWVRLAGWKRAAAILSAMNHEANAGEEPENRGGALLWRLKQAAK